MLHIFINYCIHFLQTTFTYSLVISVRKSKRSSWKTPSRRMERFRKFKPISQFHCNFLVCINDRIYIYISIRFLNATYGAWCGWPQEQYDKCTHRTVESHRKILSHFDTMRYKLTNYAWAAHLPVFHSTLTSNTPSKRGKSAKRFDFGMQTGVPEWLKKFDVFTENIR